MLANAKLGRFFGIISVAFMFGSGIPYTCIPLVLPSVVTEDNVTIRSFPNPSDLIFLDVQVSPIYEIVYILETLSCCVLYTVFCGTCSLTAKFATHACGQCEVLMYIIEEIIEGGDRNRGTINQRIKTAVTQHLRILKFVSDVDKILNEICLAEFINASCNICLLGYYVIMDWHNQESMLQIFVYFLAFVSIIFNIYIFCYIGEQLVDRYQKIGIKCYMIEWYRLPQNKARDLIFPMIMSNYPIELTAGKMITMSISSFSNILKTSMAYFNLIREQKSAFASDIMKQNKFHVSDFYYAVQISICLLKPIGAWPLRQQATKVEIIVHGLSIAVATFLQFFAVTSWITCMIITKWSFYEILRTACPLIFTITVFLRYLLLLSHQHEIKSCIDRVAEDWRNVTIAEDREIMLANAKSGRFFGIISVAFMFGSGLPYNCMPLVLPPIVTEDNVTIRSFPNPCELIFLDVQVSPVYEITYALVALSCFTAYTVFCGICSLTAKFVTHICGQCEILMYIFDELVDGGERNRGTVDQRISTAMVHHLRILKFVSDVDKILNEICLAEFINASCNICLLGYYVIMDWNNQESMLQIFVYFVAFISITFNIYIFCYIGERIVEQCQKVGIKCYMIEWYRLPRNKARDLIFPIIMSNYPVELTAGKMVKLTMNSFSNILKASMAYLNLLREVSSQDM
ncbi:uncharacterized protein LOC126854633 [Cataglyphis hispanica]|uniref:uncharacterized protein LOC126854633 n=1 Tax=Cataglyphis hispanica TaxID=1086592 RepID=UPI00217FE1AF|nr:uncharacterized protein LOC126854633 [Cataglyphis hispanica]